MTGFTEEELDLTTRFCFLLSNCLDIHLSKFPSIPFCFSLKSKPRCKTLSKALEISQNTIQEYWWLSKFGKFGGEYQYKLEPI